MCQVVRLVYAYVLRLGATTIRKRMVGVKVKLPALLYSKSGIETMRSLRTFLLQTRNRPYSLDMMCGGLRSGSGHRGYDKNMAVSV
jgi:hypothetical protein